jgi:O-antigen/teichoic acid export membrane protein
LSAFLLGISNSINSYFTRIDFFKQLSTGKVFKSVSYSVLQLLFGILGWMNWGLISGLILGQLVSTLYLLWVLLVKTDYQWKIKTSEAKILLKKYMDIPLFNSLISGISNLSSQLPVFMLMRFFGEVPVSQYGIANRVLSTPISLIGQSIGQVFFKEASVLNNQGKSMHDFVKNTFVKLFKYGILPVLAIIAIAPWAFSVFFGENYLEAGHMAQLILPWLFLGFIIMPVTPIFIVLNKQKTILLLNSISLVLRGVLLWAGYYFYSNIYVAVGLFSLGGFLINGFYMFYYPAVSKQTAKY